MSGSGAVTVTAASAEPHQARLRQVVADCDALTEALIERQNELATLYALSHSLHVLDGDARLDARHILAGTLELLQAQFGAEVVFAVLPEAGVRLQQPAGALTDDTLDQLFDAVVATGEVQLQAADGAARGHLVAPLFASDAIVAGIGVVGGAFGYPERKLLRTIADVLGTQLENARLHALRLKQARIATELDLAGRIQTQLLPRRLPTVPGVTVAARTVPAQAVGGDFYDFYPLARGLSFAVGDVSGKGFSAAVVMGMTRTTLRSAAHFVPDARPALQLAHANAALYADFTDVSMFATAFVAQYEAERKLLWYANAGHSPVIYRPANGRARLLEADGTALGILPTCLSADHSLHFGPGDLLVVATDGLNDAQNERGEHLGYDRLLAHIDALADGDAAALERSLFEMLDRFTGAAAQADDQTVLILKGVEP